MRNGKAIGNAEATISLISKIITVNDTGQQGQSWDFGFGKVCQTTLTRN